MFINSLNDIDIVLKAFKKIFKESFSFLCETLKYT